MEALEFSTRIEHGIIRLPKEFEEYGNAYVRIIVLAERPIHSPTKKDQLKEIMLKMGEKNIFSKISHPLEWQKKIRNEWE